MWQLGVLCRFSSQQWLGKAWLADHQELARMYLHLSVYIYIYVYICVPTYL